MWSTDTICGQVMYLYGNRYAQVFYNGTYFAETFPIAKKSEVGQALKTFVMELGILEELTVNVSKE